MQIKATPVARARQAISFSLLFPLMIYALGCGSDGTPPAQGGSAVARPTIEGPVTGGTGKPFIASTTFDLAQVGYVEAEYFISGTATAYTNVGPLSADGKWQVEAADQAAYKTRLLVYRPSDPTKFNGTVVVEWLNVSGGLDAAADWVAAHTELIRDGFAWVGVSAQYVGVEGGAPLLGFASSPLKEADPARYGSLVHPGDSFSYDIFSQAAQAIRRPSGPDPMAGLPVAAVIAAGDSQSAFRLVTYIDAIHPLAEIYDGFLVHSRGGGTLGSAAALSQAPQPAIAVPGDAVIRDDLDVPVLTFETETDLTLLGYATARQADTAGFRLWEVAGAAHADTYTTGIGATDLGDSPAAAALVLNSNPVQGFPCSAPINSGPGHFVLNAAFAALNRWVRDGTPPPEAPRLELDDGGMLVLDAHGNAVGGIRTPEVDVPIAALSGLGQSGIICLLFGSTQPFDQATLASLYPTHDAYVSAYDAAADRAVTAGFLLPPDAALMKEAAAAAMVGS